MKPLPGAVFAVLLAAILTGPAEPAKAGDATLAKAAAGGYAIFMRHAIAPGTGDPSRFRLGDCSTQRNLSEEGRQQARRIGATLRRAGLQEALVYSSQWCRASETARLLDLATPGELPALNSFFARPGQQSGRMTELLRWLAAHPLDRPLVLVTHQVNITAFSGANPASGEMIVMRRDDNGRWRLAGRVAASGG